MRSGTPEAFDQPLPVSTSIAVLAARFNGHIVEVLLDGCLKRLKEIGVDESRIDVQRVPGAFELPVAAKLYAETKRYQAVICLGCVIRGETAHFDYVAGEAARGIMQVSLSSGVPVIFGVLTVENEQQAQARAGGSHGHAGVSSADAAAEMIRLALGVRR
ncbi:MAG: 6,7-dimethyl-8-ribityllumazine synthase [Tepidisphaeraceae bacterium]